METARINSFRLQRSLSFLRVRIVILRSCVFVATESVGIGACFVEKFYGTVRACLGLGLPHVFAIVAAFFFIIVMEVIG